MARTIAYCKRWKAWARLMFQALIILSLPLASIWVFGREYDPLKSDLAPKAMIVSAWIFSFFIVRDFIADFRELVFHGGRLIWIDNGEVIWKFPSNFSVPCKDIMRVFGGFGGQLRHFDTITFQLSDGSEKTIETDELIETCDEVVIRLKSALNIA